ncbi:dual specificity protein phosphatase 3-like [Bradysia coprophila]|uniref:dual specificity protein phosphatase 3-like n=1 Tax=Bradysia coprophila TaxID=38358 RepID=UPI00187DAEDE|nr:dual specificity protein phosphatase 3-like [Bradysia coprophila]
MTANQTSLIQLQDVFLKTRCTISPFFRVVDNEKYYVDCDEVYPNLFVGNGSAAKNLVYLKRVGITHVVNMAESDVDTDANYYRNDNINYLGVAIADSPSTKINDHFEAVTKFIENGIKRDGGKVLVHCFMGYSRSATCAIAYLMICEKLDATTACQIIKSKHVCRPNDGFLQQLVELDNHLRSDKR